MLNISARLGFHIFLIAIAVVLCGGGTVLILLEVGTGKIFGYALTVGGVCLAIGTLLMAVQTWMRAEQAEPDPLSQAEAILEKQQRQRHVKAIENGNGLMGVLTQENSVTARQVARAKRVRSAHRRDKSKI